MSWGLEFRNLVGEDGFVGIKSVEIRQSGELQVGSMGVELEDVSVRSITQGRFQVRGKVRLDDGKVKPQMFEIPGDFELEERGNCYVVLLESWFNEEEGGRQMWLELLLLRS